MKCCEWQEAQMGSIISDLLDTIQSRDVSHATRQISFEWLLKLADRE